MEENRKRAALQAYFAGIFDGEGCVSIARPTNGTYKVMTSVKMDDPQAVLMLWREYPEALLHRRVRQFLSSDGSIREERAYYDFTLTHYKGERFLREVLPFSLIKHEQIKVALAFLSHRRREHSNAHGKKGFDCGGRCERFRELLASLKRGPKGVNSVNALLDHEMREYRAKREEVEQDVTILLTKTESMYANPYFDLRRLREGVETSGAALPANKPISAPEKEIVHIA